VSVAAARAAGAVVLGKTATTEFACQSSAATANPHNLAHTPGGSSSGTAAAVADWMVPIGFGTQTAGSIIRPASYCGVVGYKPSFDKVAKSGVKLIAESLDTIGALARTVSDAAFFVGAITQDPDLLELPVVERRLRIGLCRTHDWQQLSPAMEATFESVAQQLSAAGTRVSLVELPDQFAALGDAHAEIQGFEAVRNFASELRDHRQQLSPPLLAMLEAGSGVSRDSYAKSQGVAGQCRSRFSAAMGECDVLLTASATGEAPQGFASTGSPVMNRTWTLLHVPCVNVPAAFAPNGLPVGVQVVGRLNDDATTLAIADWIHRRLQS
jgi:Asp-tRNA(Asn)/Glu-tRNA(Gln) amidotransferase A subunit family amidase